MENSRYQIIKKIETHKKSNINTYNIPKASYMECKKLNSHKISMNNHQDVAVPLDPEWIVGFTDGEGSFHLSKRKRGPVKPKFSIGLNMRDKPTLLRLQKYLEAGSVSDSKKNNAAIWTVNGNADIRKLIAFFSIHRLRSKKQRDFLIWKRTIKYPLHDPRRLMFKEIIIKLRPRPFRTTTPISYQWLLGFIEGEGGFIVGFRNNKDNQSESETKEDRRVECTFQITQKEKAILDKIAEYIGAGTVRPNQKGKYIYYLPTTELGKLTSILKEEDFISPHKRLDYINWKKIKALVNSKKHLTEEGYAEVKLLHSQMHKYEKFIVDEKLLDESE